jgi:putative ABC transport system permease protein
MEAATCFRAMPSYDFGWQTINYYFKHTGIPLNFGITITVALLVGTLVAGQTFYTFTLENLKQFGALKAIGVTNWRITRMILLQAGMMGSIGYCLASPERRSSISSQQTTWTCAGSICRGKLQQARVSRLQ